MKFIVMPEEGKIEYVRNLDNDATLSIGKITKEVLKKASNGDIVTSTKGKSATLIEPRFIDMYKSMKRGAQAINLKDCGIILAETLVGKEDICLDCGAGMGGLTCFLSRYVKKVYSVDFVSKHLDNVKKNAEMLGLKNIKFIEADIYKGIPTKSKLSLITLDVKNPEEVVEHSFKSLIIGGYLVAYTPQATQMLSFVNKARDVGFVIDKSIEIGERKWKAEGLILRPEHVGLMHTGFITFARKLKK